jgi:sacsin
VPQVIGRNGGDDTLAHWPTTSGLMTIDEACCEVLKYLDKVWGSLSSSGGFLFLYFLFFIFFY